MTTLQWLPSGAQFGFDDLVYWGGKANETFEQAAPRFDTVVLAPHASAAFPQELQAFINPQLTQRKQFDFSDVLTYSLAHAWAEADPHVVVVSNPVSRLVLDPNRAPPADPVADLREFFTRWAQQNQGEKVSFAGIDAIRPVTFSGEAVLLEPHSSAQWEDLSAVLLNAIARTVLPYRKTCERVVQYLLAHASARRPFYVISLHDTMNTKMRDDGAIVVERPAADRLPHWVNFGNKGNQHGEFSGDALTLGAAELRRIAQAWHEALPISEAQRGHAITLNQPYKGAYETVHFGALLQARGLLYQGAVQVEFLREALLGARATAELHQPGNTWPELDSAHLNTIALALTQAGAVLRQLSHP